MLFIELAFVGITGIKTGTSSNGSMSWRPSTCFWICGMLWIACLAFEVRAAESGATLRCFKDSIYIELSEGFLSERKIEVNDPRQLHFNGFPECYSNSESTGYSITLFPPFKNCGTKVQPETDTYSYSNEIVFETTSSKIRIFTFRCDYDKKYIVSSNLALTPVIKKLNFVTARGEFGVGMGLYQRSDFNPKSMFSPRPTVLVGTSVYVSVDVLDTFGMKEIASTIETCYATDEKNHAVQKLYHSLIVNRCSSPDDDTVQIISNGESMSARFRFQMFQWKSNVEYFYLHCGVKVCNRTEGECSGVGPVCTGIPDDQGLFSSRRKREVDPIGTPIKGDKGIITLGPIAAKEKEQEEEIGVGTYEMVFEEIEKDQKFLQVYIYTAVAAAIVVGGIVAIVVTVARKHRAGKRRKLENISDSI